MKPSPTCLIRHPLTVLAAALGLALLAAPAANAFTFDNQSNVNADGSARYVDPDSQFSGSASGQTTIQSGNTTLRFGSQSQGTFDQRYDPNRLFDPNRLRGQ